MNKTFNVYCDESCHLEHDRQKAMVLGALWCPLDRRRAIAARAREIKRAHGLSQNFEVKWTKVSPAKAGLYLDLVDFFFDDDDMRLRALIAPDKSMLRHDVFPGQDHDTWYYKMHFDMLKVIFGPGARYRVYLDIKDTCGARKAAKLLEVLRNNAQDFSADVIERLQLVHSHEIEQLQLVDLLIGAISYVNRGLRGSPAKKQLVAKIQQRCGCSLSQTTPYHGGKVNLLCWQASEVKA